MLSFISFFTMINDEIGVHSHYLQDSLHSGFHQYTCRYQLDRDCSFYKYLIKFVFYKLHSRGRQNLSVKSQI